MSTLTIPDNTQENRQAARQLQTTMAAARVGFTWFGTRKTLTPEQKAEAADTFGAEGEFVSAGKKLLDTRNPRFKAVTAVRNQIGEYWRSISLPFPEPGLRLIQQERLDEFQEKMTGFKRELDAAVRDLDRHFDAMKSAARDRLGRLFNSNDYPSTLIGLFDVSWDFPSVQAPEYLRELNPALYREECQRVQARFEEAVRLAESAFVDELAKLVSHLTERLSGQEDGRPKVFRDSAVGNLRAFFDQFKSLNVRSNDQLDRLVEQCQQVVQGIEPQQLRDSGGLRQHVVTQLAGVQATLDGMLVDRPRRRIVRPSANGASHEPRD
ncbi:MAG: hypothetical protein K8T89_00930 [Planctomycetes bacterium]|nr:hypothetical protein [Planctomycetota bacterium]